ncbi:MAG: hypothetical protein ABIS70_10150 [Actinomycetota bacterium]
MTGLLLLSCTFSAATAGALMGAAWDLTGLSITLMTGSAIGVVAVVLDQTPLRPLAVRRQVPMVWSRVFGMKTAAVLYGLRLGIGPATILNTWVWWAFAVTSASLGLQRSAIVGAAFGFARASLIAIVSLGVQGSMAVRMGRVQSFGGTTRRLLAGVVAAFCIAGLLSACRPASTSKPRPLPVASTFAAVCPAPIDDSLDAILIDDALAGFAVADPDLFAVGPLDLEAAAAEEDDVEAERSLLITREFQRGYAKAWTNATEDVVVATVYLFAEPRGAKAYLDDTLISLEGTGAQRVEITTPPGGAAFSQTDEDDQGTLVTHGVVFVSGDLFLALLGSTTGSGLTLQDLRTLAETQFERISTTTPPSDAVSPSCIPT